MQSYLHFFLDGSLSVRWISFTLLLICTLGIEPIPMSQADQVGNSVLVQFVAPLNSCSSVGISVARDHVTSKQL